MRKIIYLALVSLGGCVDDPVYLRPTPGAIEVNGAMPGATTATVILQVREETAEQALDRTNLAMQLGIADPALLPRVRRDDLEVEIEWTIKNLDDSTGTATISAVGANEFIRYNPAAFVIDPDEDEAPPPLLGGIPEVIPPLGTVSGVFREDELSEAMQDLDAITRGGIAPENATLTRWPTDEVTGGLAPGFPMDIIPSPAIPALLQYDVSFAADRHMVLEFVVRVRDHSDRLLEVVTATDIVVPPSTTDYAPPPPPMP